MRQVHRGKKYIDIDIMEHLHTEKKFGELSELTAREKEILMALGKGKTNREIVESLFITESTVKKHVSQVLFKLELRDRTQAAIYVNNLGLTV